MIRKFYLFLAFLMLIAAKGGAVESPNAASLITFRTEGGELAAAVPVNGNTVIKFTADSIEFKNGIWRSGALLEECALIACEKGTYMSDFSVKVKSGIEDVGLGDKVCVILKGNYVGEYFGFVQLPDRDGVACFYDLPAGFYSVDVVDEAGVFSPVSVQNVAHGYGSDYVEIILGNLEAGLDAPAMEEPDGEPEYYDLRGIRVSPSNLSPGVYIRRGPRGNVEKVRIR